MNHRESNEDDLDLSNFDPNEEFAFEEEEVKLDDDVSNVVVFDNLPIDLASKAEKMKEVLKKVIKKNIKSAEPLNTSLPLSSDGKTKGFAFVEFAEKQTAESVRKKLNGFAFGKNTLRVNLLSEVEKVLKTPIQEVKYVPKPLKEMPNLQSWLLDSRARDQFAIRYGATTDVYWNDTINKSQLITTRSKWTEDRIGWSPLGSYFVTWHSKGIALWGGEEWKNLATFVHKNPVYIDFSPKERYIVTANEDDRDNLIVTEIRTGIKHKFSIPKRILQNTWPIFKWSADERYFAYLASGKIFFHDSTSFKKPSLDKKTIPIEQVQDFEWSPSDPNIFVYWTPDKTPLPGKIGIYDISKNHDEAEQRFKNYFGITGVTFYWNKSGDYLTVHVERSTTKAKKNELHYLEIFRMRMRNIPIESIEYRDSINHFSWEPYGHRFGVIYGSTMFKKRVAFYSCQDSNTKKIKNTMENKNVDHMFWSPKGRFVILANTQSMEGVMEFWDVDEFEMVSKVDHYMMSDLEWDPSGRYVATSVSAFLRKSEFGYIIWNCLGKIHHRFASDQFYAFTWRPRPKSVISEADEKKIAKSFNEKKKQYIEEEKKAQKAIENQILKQRKDLWEDFQATKERLLKEHQQLSKGQEEEVENSDDYTIEIEEKEEEISVEREEIDE